MNFLNSHISEPDRLSDRINELLRGAIFDGELKPGDKLPTEEQIAAELKVSKVTVREALRQLEAEGLIEKRRGQKGGSFVASPTYDKISQLIGTYLRWQAVNSDHLAQFRTLLEPRIAALAAASRTKEDLAVIQDNIRDQEQCLAGDRADVRLSIHFHQLVADACHNPIISAVVNAVAEAFFESITWAPPTREIMETDLDYSRRLYDCLAEGRAREAEELMEDHFHYFSRVIIRYQAEQAD